MAPEISKDVEHALRWLKKEFEPLQRPHQEFETIERQGLKSEDREWSRDGRAVRYIQNAEKRVEGDVRDILTQLHRASKDNIPVRRIHAFLAETGIPIKDFLFQGSLYVKELLKQLDTIRTDAAIERKYPNSDLQRVVRSELQRLDAKVEDIIMWVTALNGALLKIAGIRLRG